jgi:hypothetical protein
MSDDRALRAIDRIERAFARIEAGSGPGRPAATDEALVDLRRTHHALRGKVEDAIARIDQLLTTEGAG